MQPKQMQQTMHNYKADAMRSNAIAAAALMQQKQIAEANAIAGQQTIFWQPKAVQQANI
jgi:hypothetical protein